jgi:hypothetical protein
MANSTTQRKLARRHLATILERLTAVRDIQRPPKGWIRAIRDALGMSAEQPDPYHLARSIE